MDAGPEPGQHHDAGSVGQEGLHVAPGHRAPAPPVPRDDPLVGHRGAHAPERQDQPDVGHEENDGPGDLCGTRAVAAVRRGGQRTEDAGEQQPERGRRQRGDGPGPRPQDVPGEDTSELGVGRPLLFECSWPGAVGVLRGCPERGGRREAAGALQLVGSVPRLGEGPPMPGRRNLQRDFARLQDPDAGPPAGRRRKPRDVLPAHQHRAPHPPSNNAVGMKAGTGSSDAPRHESADAQKAAGEDQLGRTRGVRLRPRRGLGRRQGHQEGREGEEGHGQRGQEHLPCSGGGDTAGHQHPDALIVSRPDQCRISGCAPRGRCHGATVTGAGKAPVRPWSARRAGRGVEGWRRHRRRGRGDRRGP